MSIIKSGGYKSMFNEKLKTLRERDDLSQTRFANEIGFSQAAISAWENGTREPGIAAILQIARFFNVSTDYLIGDGAQNSQKNPTSDLTSEEKHLLETFRKLDMKNRMHVSIYADVRLEEQGPTTKRA